MKFIQSDNLPQAIGPYSPAIKVNGMIYTSAQVPVTLDGTIVERDI
jgi:2-iminobutanoate/2-iminopropanoate deaminase